MQYEMVPGVFRFLHPVVPQGNFIEAARRIQYFGNVGLLRPTLVRALVGGRLADLRRWHKGVPRESAS